MFYIRFLKKIIEKISELLISFFLVSYVSESLRSLTKNEQCEQKLLRSLTKNERPYLLHYTEFTYTLSGYREISLCLARP